MEVLEQLVEDVKDFGGSAVPRIHCTSALEFLRDFVAPNRPCILTGLLDGPEWRNAMNEWTTEKLAERCGKERKVRVNVTPDGHGDCVLPDKHGNKIFVKPWETEMSMEEFLTKLQAREPDFVPYLSHQNDNLRDQEFEFLATDVPSSLSLGVCLGALDAVNIWIGDDRAVSSMHQDFYENLYCVVQGEKVFHLLSPLINPKLFLQEAEFPSGHYEWDEATREWSISVDAQNQDGGGPPSTVPWIPFDVANPPAFETERERRLTELYQSAMLECRVRKGEILYLPGMWLHRATQSELTVAVNYWHDMNFDARWVTSRFMSAVAEQLDR